MDQADHWCPELKCVAIHSKHVPPNPKYLIKNKFCKYKILWVKPKTASDVPTSTVYPAPLTSHKSENQFFSWPSAFLPPITPHLSRLWILTQWASSESRGDHKQRSTPQSSYHTFFIKAIFQKWKHAEGLHSSGRPHSRKQIHIYYRRHCKGMKSLPWTNMKPICVRNLKKCTAVDYKRWEQSSLQGVVNTTQMVQSLDKICIYSKLLTAGIFTKTQS